MNINFDKNIIALFGKAYKLDVLIRKFAILSGNQIYHFLSNRRIQIPRALNVMALTAVLNKKILLLNTSDLEKEEFNRLQYYQYFTEEQLFRLIKRLGISDEEFEEYRMNIFKLIVENSEALDLSDGEFSYLKNLKKLPIESFEEYFNFVSGASLESSNTFDGVDLDILERYFPLTATDEDIQDICDKYGIEIPLKLEQGEYLNYVSNYLNQTNKASRTVMNELSRMNLEQLETYCERMDIPMHSNMSTSDRARYLLYYLSLCDISKTVVDNLVADDSYYPIEFNIDYNKINKGIDGPCIIFNHNDDVMEAIEEENDEDNSIDAIEENNDNIASNENSLDNNQEDIDNSSDNSFDPILDDSLVEEVVIDDSDNIKDENLDVQDSEVENTNIEANEVEDNQDNTDSNDLANDNSNDIPFDEIPNPFLDENSDNNELDNDNSELDNDDISTSFEELTNENKEDNNKDIALDNSNNKNDNLNINDDFDPFNDIDKVNIDDDTEALIDSILETNDNVEEEKKVVLDESLKDVRANESFGDRKVLKLTQGKAGLITAISLSALGLMALGFIVWALLFR